MAESRREDFVIIIESFHASAPASKHKHMFSNERETPKISASMRKYLGEEEKRESAERGALSLTNTSCNSALDFFFSPLRITTQKESESVVNENRQKV